MEKYLSIHKRAQIWGLDLGVAVAIFSVSLTIFYFYALNGKAETFEKIESMHYEGKQISDNLLSSGYPPQWNEQSVLEIGLTSDGKINDTKLGYFYNLTQTDYNRTKSLLRTGYDYYFFINGENMTFGSQNIRGIGKPDFNLDNFDVKDIINIQRIGVYKNKPVELRLYLWNE